MADTRIQYDATGVTPTSMNGITFGRLTTLPPPKRIDAEKLLMARLFYEDSSHDLLKPNKSFDEWGVNYKGCLAKLFPNINININSGNVGPSDNGFFKAEVTRRSLLVAALIEAGAHNNGSVFAAAAAANNANTTINNNICPHPVRAETFPHEYNGPLIVSQNVDNFTYGGPPAIPVLITPARFYDACCRTSQENVYDRLLEWWRVNVAPPEGVEPLVNVAERTVYPFCINLLEQGITSIPGSYLFVAIQKINPDGPDVSSNFFLVFVIKLGTIQKTIKFRLERDNGCPEGEVSGDYLLLGGKNLAKCFFEEFEEIYAPTITLNDLNKIPCLKKKSKPNTVKGRGQRGGVKQPKTQSKTPSKKNIESSIRKDTNENTNEDTNEDTKLYSLYNNNHLLRLLNSYGPVTIGSFLIISKLLGDFLVSVTTPDNTLVGTNDFLLCANNNINNKKTLFVFNRGGIVSRILFTPTAIVAAPPARAAPVAAPASSTKKGIAKKGIAKKVAKKTFVKVRSSVRQHSIKARKKISEMLIGKIKNKKGVKVGGGVISIAVPIANKYLYMTPNKYTESKRAEAELARTNETIKMYSYMGKQLDMDKTFEEQGVTEGSNIYKIITTQTEVTKTDNSFYSLITIESFKLMLKKFIDNLKGVVKINDRKYISRIRVEEVEEVQEYIYTLNDTPNFAKRVTKIISFYEVIYGISNDSLLEALTKTNRFGVLELITPVSPFIPKEGESDSFVFLLCPNWSTSIRYAEQYLKMFLTSPETTNIEVYLTAVSYTHLTLPTKRIV